MASDPFARIRKVDTGLSTSFQEHLEHAEPVAVFAEKPQISANAHQEHQEHVKNLRLVKTDPVTFGPFEPARVVPSIRHEDFRHIPEPWRGGLRRLNFTSCPGWLQSDWWQVYVTDAFKFAFGFGEEAIAAGWTPGSLFGVTEAPGLISLIADIRGGEVVSLWQDDRGRAVASILDRGGRHRCHYRQVADDSPMLWKVDPRKITQQKDEKWLRP